MSARALLGVAALSVGPFLLGAQAREPEDVARREEYFRQQLAYPFHEIPEASLRQLVQIRLERARASSFAMALVGGTFVPIGPSGLLAQDGFWTSGQQLDAGRVSRIAFHPTDPDTWYAATAGGGLWKTANAGASWVPLTDAACSLNTGAIAVDPKNPSYVYLGTGELDAGSLGCGVLRSIDGGTSWLPAVIPSGMNSSGTFANSTGALYVDSVTAGSTSGTTVLLGSSRGVFRSTNSGLDWNKVLPPVQSARADNIVAHPNNPSILYAGLGGPNNANAGIYRSADKGATWSALPMPAGLTANDIYRLGLATSKASPEKLWVFVAGGSPTLLTDGFVWDGASEQWTTIDVSGVYTGVSRGDFGAQAWYDFVVAVDPSDVNRIFVAGLRLFRTTDGGSTWRRIASEIHVDWHALVFDPANPRRMLGGNDGGVFVTLDGGETWTARNFGLAITQYYPGISLHPSDAMVVLGGSQDNGSHVSYGTPVWQGITGGDGGFSAINHSNPAIMWTTCQWLPGACLSRKNPSTGQWEGRSQGISSSDRAQFIPPLVMDPNLASTLYFGTQRLYRTTNESNWLQVGTVGDLTKGSGTITAIAPGSTTSGTAAQTIYVATSDGSIRVTQDGGTTWDAVGTGLSNVFFTDIAVDPQDNRTAYAVSSSFTSPHVFKTTNGGTSWTSITGNLPDIPVFAVAYIPGSNALVIGTQIGVYQSADGGATWSPGPPGIPMLPVRDLAYNSRTNILVAATHGRGMFMLRLGASSAVLRGDVNRDNQVNAADALLIQKALVGQSLGGDGNGAFVALPRGDANCNGVLEAVDALIVLRQSVGLSTGGSCVNTSAIRAAK